MLVGLQNSKLALQKKRSMARMARHMPVRDSYSRKLSTNFLAVYQVTRANNSSSRMDQFIMSYYHNHLTSCFIEVSNSPRGGRNTQELATSVFWRI